MRTWGGFVSELITVSAEITLAQEQLMVFLLYGRILLSLKINKILLSISLCYLKINFISSMLLRKFLVLSNFFCIFFVSIEITSAQEQLMLFLLLRRILSRCSLACKKKSKNKILV